MAASRCRQALESSLAGTARRVNLARECAVDAAWGFINALGSTTPAGILIWVLRRLVWPLLLLVLRPFIPGILRKYFLWKSWAKDRAGDFVDYVCVDKGKQAERRRVIETRWLGYGVQVAKLNKLNEEVADIARKAAHAFSSNSSWLAGKYEHLRPTEFAGRVAAVVPEEGPVPVLGLWTRLRQRIDVSVYVADQTIRRIESAMARNQASIADLEHQLAFRSQELRAIHDQVRICQARAKQEWMRAQIRPRQLAALRPTPKAEPETRAGEGSSLHERLQAKLRKRLDKTASVSNTVVLYTPPADATSAITTTTTTTITTTNTTTTTAEHPPSTVVTAPLPAPPSSPTPEEILALAAATPLPRTAEEIAIDAAMESIEQHRA
jgi:hypothetical protein